MIDLGELRKSFGSCSEDEIVHGCHAVNQRIETWEHAKYWLGHVINRLLNANRYRAAAHILWGTDLFDPRPQSVAKLLDAIENNAKVIVLGSASTGKSYSVVCWLILDWLRDPEYTGVRIISTTSAHAIQNTFSSLQRFYEEALIPLPGISQHGFIGLNPKDRHASLSIIAIKQGESGKQSLQGFHPIRRKRPHPVFGSLSRIRLFLDEAELIPSGVWRGVSNLLSNLHGVETVKAIAATNPWDVTSILANNAEPSKGFNRVDPDRDFEWISKQNWKTIRLDAAYSENVVQRKQIFPGLMSFEGFEEYRAKTSGEDANYWCYGRGMYPRQGTIDCLIPLYMMDDFYGEYIFAPGSVVGVGGVDLAFDGDDETVFFIGRYGLARGFHPIGGTPIQFAKERYVVQLDQFRTLTRCKTEAKYNQIRAIADAFGVSYDWLAIDRTGGGQGVSDLFYERGFRNMMGISWGAKASHTKILDEDRSYPDEIYGDNCTEMYCALKSYMQYGFVKCSPKIDMEKLQKEIIGRKRGKPTGLGSTGEPMFRIEPKDAFKKRYGFSPDRADALVMLLHVARLRGPQRAQMARDKRVYAATGTHDANINNVEFVDFSVE